MGAGKSTIGRLLSRELKYKFFDTDRMLVRGFGKSVTRVFKENGEEAFRAAELQVLGELVKRSQIVVSTGGGTLGREDAMAMALAHGLVVYLRAPVEDLYERVIFSPKDRPILEAPNTESVFRSLFTYREQFYNRAHVVVDTRQKHPEEVVREILTALTQLPQREELLEES